MSIKFSIIAVSLLGLWHGNCLAEKPLSDIDKVNYSLGYELGKDIKGQELELTADMLLQGARDAIEGNKPLVKKSGRIKALKDIRAQRSLENLEKSKAYLAENAKKEGVISLPSGLQYKVIQAGDGKTPGLDNSVLVHYRGHLIDGTEFDNTFERKPRTFQVKTIIKGWREALQLMKEGDKWELYIPPELGFGKFGRKKIIPPNSALIYEVQLISVKPGGKPVK